MTNGNTLIDGINQGHGTLGKLAKDEQLYDRMNSTLAHVDTITARIDQVREPWENSRRIRPCSTI